MTQQNRRIPAWQIELPAFKNELEAFKWLKQQDSWNYEEDSRRHHETRCRVACGTASLLREAWASNFLEAITKLRLAYATAKANE